MHIRREKIKELRKALEEGNLLGTALRKCKIKSTRTVYAWDEKTTQGRLRKLLEAARERGQGTRDDLVEDAQFKRLVAGMAAGSEYQFYLTNRRTDRWKKTTEFGSTQGAPIIIKPPVINYVSVSVKVDKSGESESNGHVNGNGNGRHLDHV
jgi:hypothetical protein